jgi:hypothetical protein
VNDWDCTRMQYGLYITNNVECEREFIRLLYPIVHVSYIQREEYSWHVHLVGIGAVTWIVVVTILSLNWQPLKSLCNFWGIVNKVDCCNYGP